MGWAMWDQRWSAQYRTVAFWHFWRSKAEGGSAWSADGKQLFFNPGLRGGNITQMDWSCPLHRTVRSWVIVFFSNFRFVRLGHRHFAAGFRDGLLDTILDIQLRLVHHRR